MSSDVIYEMAYILRKIPGKMLSFDVLFSSTCYTHHHSETCKFRSQPQRYTICIFSIYPYHFSFVAINSKSSSTPICQNIAMFGVCVFTVDPTGALISPLSLRFKENCFSAIGMQVGALFI